MRILLCLFILVSLSCSEDNPHSKNDCEPVIIDESIFNLSPFYGVDLIDYTLEGACLKVSLSAGGCNELHIIEMVTDGGIDESLPPQITFDFHDRYPQPCKAAYTLEREFDLTPIYDLYDDDIIIRFRENDTSITFEQ